MERKYFSIDGYWKDNKEEFEGYIVTNFDSMEDNSNYEEEDIFMFGMDENLIIEDIESVKDTIWDFVITSYEEVK
jgi:hypothetical protein